jgi:hypothetical protein
LGEQHSDKKEEFSHHGLLVRRLLGRNDFTRFAKRFLEINWVNTVSCYGLILGGGVFFNNGIIPKKEIHKTNWKINPYIKSIWVFPKYIKYG